MRRRVPETPEDAVCCAELLAADECKGGVGGKDGGAFQKQSPYKYYLRAF